MRQERQPFGGGKSKEDSMHQATVRPGSQGMTGTRTAPDVLQPKPVKKKEPLGTGARVALAGLTLLGTGAGAKVAYDNIPAVHQSIDSLGNALAERWNSIVNNPDTKIQPIPEDAWSNTAPIVTMSEKNMIDVTPERAKELSPAPAVINEQDKTVSFLNFLELPQGESVTWERIKLPEQTDGKDVYALKGILPAGTKIKTNPVYEEKVGYSAKLNKMFPDSSSEKPQPERDPSLAVGVYKFYFDPNKNKIIRVNVFLSSIPPTIGKPFSVSPIGMSLQNNTFDYKYLTEVQPDITIATVTKPTEVVITNWAYLQTDGDPQTLYTPVLVSENNSDGTQKIADVKSH